MSCRFPAIHVGIPRRRIEFATGTRVGISPLRPVFESLAAARAREARLAYLLSPVEELESR